MRGKIMRQLEQNRLGTYTTEEDLRRLTMGFDQLEGGMVW